MTWDSTGCSTSYEMLACGRREGKKNRGGYIVTQSGAGSSRGDSSLKDLVRGDPQVRAGTHVMLVTWELLYVASSIELGNSLDWVLP